MKRFWWLLLAGLALAGEGERYLYVRWDAEKGQALLSNGTPLPPGVSLLPGQYVEWEGGRLKPKGQWQPPQDLVRVYTPREASRVVFSHERHFAALGAKGSTCETCHTALDKNKTWKSLAPSPALEAHSPTSLGRFCATCHDGRTRPASLEGGRSPLKDPIFTAFGRRGDAFCSQCHAPKDHGLDFTQGHGDKVEHGGARECAACHRGVYAFPSQEAQQVRAFQKAQLDLIRNPEDEKAFNVVLPANFCAYCHGLDGKAWNRKD
ncbi:cytochrome c3 family protein [Thermus amyloliquefaciens]|uniref:cytochrome c3 family protein n=1 Tax=Thermus amyloliquefaciens TaxID=1449080 RepID=UPI000570E3A9|nr:cytochrome c3 family protein [Thermus amyloliquefaciens]